MTTPATLDYAPTALEIVVNAAQARDYDRGDRCTVFGEHLADPHAADCPRNDTPPVTGAELTARSGR